MQINYGRYVVNLGPLSSEIYQSARWAGDGYPAWQMFADEFERLLAFAKANGVFEMYAKELCAKAGQRDSAIEELRVAHLLAENGFPVAEWRPIGFRKREGEFLVRCRDDADVFVEVKSPGWEGEVSVEERKAGRLKEAKYRATEAFYANSGWAITFGVEKAYPKFVPKNRNLLVIADDLFFPLQYESDFWAANTLYGDAGKFTGSTCENLGGVGCLVKKQRNGRTWCEMRLFLNPYASMPLSQSLITAFEGRSCESP